MAYYKLINSLRALARLLLAVFRDVGVIYQKRVCVAIFSFFVVHFSPPSLFAPAKVGEKQKTIGRFYKRPLLRTTSAALHKKKKRSYCVCVVCV